MRLETRDDADGEVLFAGQRADGGRDGAGGAASDLAEQAAPIETVGALNPEPGAARFAIRLSAADRTGLFWMEPREVGRARAGTGPTTLMRW